MLDESTVAECGWVELLSEGKPYYYDASSETTQWEVPEEYRSWRDSEINALLKGRGSWRRFYDSEQDDYYFFDKVSNTTQWDVPPELEGKIEDWESALGQLTRDRRSKRKRTFDDVSDGDITKALTIMVAQNVTQIA